MFDRLSPLSARGVTRGDFAGPGTRQVRGRAEKEDEVLMGASVFYFAVKFQRFLRGIPTNVEHDEIVDIGLPKGARSVDLFSFMYLDCVTPQDGSAYFARGLTAVDEQNFLVGEKPAAAKWWWSIHWTPPKRARPL